MRWSSYLKEAAQVSHANIVKRRDKDMSAVERLLQRKDVKSCGYFNAKYIKGVMIPGQQKLRAFRLIFITGTNGLM